LSKQKVQTNIRNESGFFNCGGGEIRTHEGFSTLMVFKTIWDNRSLPLPKNWRCILKIARTIFRPRRAH